MKPLGPTCPVIRWPLVYFDAYQKAERGRLYRFHPNLKAMLGLTKGASQ